MDKYNEHQVGYNNYRREKVEYNTSKAVEEEVLEKSVQGMHKLDTEERRNTVTLHTPPKMQRQKTEYKVNMQEDAEIADLTQNAVEGGRKYGYKTRSLPNIRWIEDQLNNSWEAENTSQGSGSFVGGYERMLKIDSK